MSHPRPCPTHAHVPFHQSNKVSRRPRAISPVTGGGRLRVVAILMQTGGATSYRSSAAKLQQPTQVDSTTMGTFGATVTSLLDTYTKCLSLLKGFRGGDGGHGTASELQSSLGSSLRSDRARVRRAYSSQLSQNGVRFEKGDGESCPRVLAKPRRSQI